MLRIFIVVMLCVFSSHLFAENEIYIVESKITVDSKLIGSPVVLVTAGEETNLVIADAFELSILARQTESEAVLMALDLTVDGETVSPRILVEPGQEFGMGIGETVISMKIRSQSQGGI